MENLWSIRYIDEAAVQDQNDISSIEHLGLSSHHQMFAQLRLVQSKKEREEKEQDTLV
jgi:hypothetical protein